jgi:hypothetical protein
MKTAELVKLALNWAVAQCENREIGQEQYMVNVPLTEEQEEYSPSTNWAQGGPIIEEEGIEIRVHCTHNNVITSWAAEKDWPMNKTVGHCGPTPLIAAMRCFVASKLGDEVEIPEEFL